MCRYDNDGCLVDTGIDYYTKVVCLILMVVVMGERKYRMQGFTTAFLRGFLLGLTVNEKEGIVSLEKPDTLEAKGDFASVIVSMEAPCGCRFISEASNIRYLHLWMRSKMMTESTYQS